MSEFLIVLIITYSIIVFLTTIVSFASLIVESDIFLLDTPRELYEKYRMNWFGCIFIWVLEFLFNPLVWIICLILDLFYWLFTVGRKD